MQSENNSTPPALPFPLTLSPFLLLSNDLGEGGFELSRYLFLGSLLFSREGGGMDFSKVGEKLLSSVRSARSLGLIPSTSDRPEVPARAAAAAAVARVLAGLPPHQRQNLSSSSEELSSIYGSVPQNQAVDELEEDFYEEEFDPVRHILEQIPSEENEAAYFEEKATLRLAQLDRISERLSRHVMEHHEEMVKGMNLVRELEKDLKIANVICMNGRRHLTSSRNEVSRDLIVTANSRKKQALLDMLPILNELRHAVALQVSLETYVEEGNFSEVFQVLPEYVQLLDSLSKLAAVQEMSHGAEALLGKTLQKLDLLLLQVCQDFKEDGYLTVVDAYALIGDVSGLAEKIQSFFMQEVLSQSHSSLRNILQEDVENYSMQAARLTYSDLCTQVPESKFRQCLLETLGVLFKLMCSYYAITSFQLEDHTAPYHDSSAKHVSLSDISDDHAKGVPSLTEDSSLSVSTEGEPLLSAVQATPKTSSAASFSDSTEISDSKLIEHPIEERRDNGSEASSSGSLWYLLRKDAVSLISHALQRGRRNLWQLTTSRVAVLLSSSAVSSTSIHQFLRNYEDLRIFILAGEAFCGVEATEFRLKLKSICGGYFAAFHRQNIYALKMVMEKESWQIMPPDTIHVVSFAGLVGDGAALIVASDKSTGFRSLNNTRLLDTDASGSKWSGFSYWNVNGNPFLSKLSSSSEEHSSSFQPNGLAPHGEAEEKLLHSNSSSASGNTKHVNGTMSEDENEDLHADFIDEDSQLPSRVAKPSHSRHYSIGNDDMTAQTASSLSLLRLMDKYARLMQKLEIVNVEFFKGICQLFEIFFYFVFETFCLQSNSRSTGKGINDTLPNKLKIALSRITQECDQWIKPQPSAISPASPTSLNVSFTHLDVTPTTPSHLNISFGLKERCAGADTMVLVAQLLHKSKAHLQSMLMQNNGAPVEDFYMHLVDAVPELIQQIHRTTAKSLLHVDGYVDRIANAKWDVKELGMEHNGYVDLLLGEFKHFKTRLVHGGIRKEVQDLLLEYGLETIAETLIEGLSRVKRCTDEGRALMSLDLQVLINGLKHFVSADVRPKLQIVETFIKAYYLPETEFVHWSRNHPEYSKSQIVGLINLVATMKGWKRKTRLEILEKIE